MAVTDTDICNRALDLLKETPITSLEDKRPIASWCKRNFFISRDGVLSKALWNCAIKRVILPEALPKPEFGWLHKFKLPGDCIRLVSLTEYGMSEGRSIPHAVEGGHCLTNVKGPLPVRYIFRNANYDMYSPLLIDAIAGRLGRGMAHWLTGKSNYAAIALQFEQDAFRDAWLINEIEGTTPEAAADDWLDARSTSAFPAAHLLDLT